MPSGQQVEDLRRRGVGRHREQVAGHHIVHLRESVDSGCFNLADGAQRSSVLDDDRQRRARSHLAELVGEPEVARSRLRLVIPAA